jgi:hypothetical protein
MKKEEDKEREEGEEANSIRNNSKKENISHQNYC